MNQLEPAREPLVSQTSYSFKEKVITYISFVLLHVLGLVLLNFNSHYIERLDTCMEY
jgi:hypothetical protein